MFKKLLNIRFVSLILGIVFLCNTSLYAYPGISNKDSLRLHVGKQDTLDRFEGMYYGLKEGEMDGVRCVKHGLTNETTPRVYAVWREDKSSVKADAEQIVELYLNPPATYNNRQKVAKIVHKGPGELEVYLWRPEMELESEFELVTLSRFRGDYDMLFEYLTQTVASGNPADVTAILNNIGGMTANEASVYERFPYLQEAPRVDHVVVERNPYDGKIIPVQVVKPPKSFPVTPHGNTPFCQIDKALVLRAFEVIPDEGLRRRTAELTSDVIDDNVPDRIPRKYNLSMFDTHNIGSCSFRCVYCFSHAMYPDMKFFPIYTRFVDEYYEDGFYQYLLEESEGKSFLPVFFFAPDTDVASIELRKQAAMMMVALDRYNRLAKEKGRPFARMFIVTKAGPDFLDTVYGGKRAEYNGMTIGELLCSPHIHLEIAAGILNEELVSVWEPGSATVDQRFELATRYNTEIVEKIPGKHYATMLMQPCVGLFYEYAEDGSLQLSEEGRSALDVFVERIRDAKIGGASVNVLKCTEQSYERLKDVLVGAGLYHLVEQLELLLVKRAGDIEFDFGVFGRLHDGQTVKRRVALKPGRVLMTAVLKRLREAGVITPVCSIWTGDTTVAQENAQTVYENAMSMEGMDCTAVPYELYPPTVRALEMIQNIWLYRQHLTDSQRNQIAQAALELLPDAGEGVEISLGQIEEILRNPASSCN